MCATWINSFIITGAFPEKKINKRCTLLLQTCTINSTKMEFISVRLLFSKGVFSINLEEIAENHQTQSQIAVKVPTQVNGLRYIRSWV